MKHPRALLVALGCSAMLACMDTGGLPTPIDGQPGVNTTGGGNGNGSSASVSVGDNFFSPDTITIGVRDTVTWRWNGLNPHSVTFTDGSSSGVRTSGTFQRFFGTAGSYPYFSAVPTDSLMRGVVTVR